MEDDYVGGVHVSGIRRGTGRDAEAQSYAAHAQDHYTCMFRRIVRNTPHVSFDDVVAIQEWHLAIRFNPYLISCILHEIVKSSNVQTKLACLGKLAETGTEGHEIRPCYGHGQLHIVFRDVIHAVAVQAEYIGIIRPVNQVHKILSNVMSELLKECRRLSVRQWPHCVEAKGGGDVLKRHENHVELYFFFDSPGAQVGLSYGRV